MTPPPHTSCWTLQWRWPNRRMAAWHSELLFDNELEAAGAAIVYRHRSPQYEYRITWTSPKRAVRRWREARDYAQTGTPITGDRPVDGLVGATKDGE